MEKDACYGKRFSHKKRMSTIQMGCFLNPTICYESPFKIEFHKKPATVAMYRLSCFVLCRSCKLVCNLQNCYENIVYVYVVYV